MRRYAALAMLLLALSAIAQDSPALPANEIIRRVATANAVRTARLRHYQSTRVYEVDYKGFGGDRHAKMTVKIDYLGGRREFSVLSEEGSKLLLNRVVRKAMESEQEAATEEMRNRSALTETNYSFQLLTTENSDGKSYYVLQVTPRRKDKYLYDGKVWIDAAEFALARVEAQPAKNPSFWISSATIQHTNQDFSGIWLPAHNTSTSKIRMGGRASLTIDYGKYETLQTD